jgi:hypothetical protein
MARHDQDMVAQQSEVCDDERTDLSPVDDNSKKLMEASLIGQTTQQNPPLALPSAGRAYPNQETSPRRTERTLVA